MSPIFACTPWSRRQFLTTSFAGAGMLAVPAAVLAQMSSPLTRSGAPDTALRAAPKPPPLGDAIVKEFVGAAHGKFDRTREMLGNEPGLLNATWDWKAGDFETAIGGAGHMGRRDIALFLIGEGARMDLFVAAMLGELPIVRAYLAAHPALAHSEGPHGISLIAHAKAGGESAAEVLAHLEALESKWRTKARGNAPRAARVMQSLRGVYAVMMTRCFTFRNSFGSRMCSSTCPFSILTS